MTPIEQVLGAFIDAWNAGERPDLDLYLTQLPDGPERDELAGALMAWLEVAPSPDYTEEQLADIRREPALAAALAAADAALTPWSERLPALRSRAGLALADVAARLARAFSLPEAEPRTVAYLERMERDELDEHRVSRRLLDALADVLGVGRDAVAPRPLFPAAPAPAAAGGALFRHDDPAAPPASLDYDLLARAAMAPAPAPLDELDRLFLGGPDA